MTAASPVVEMVNVVVISSDKDMPSMFQLAADTTISELKRLWEAKFELPTGSILRTVDGCRLLDHQELSEIGEVAPGTRTVTVLVEEAITVSVEVYKDQVADRRPITVGLSQKPEDLHPDVRAMFALGDDRHFRLTTHDMPLSYNLSFEQHALESGAVLYVDLAYQMDVMEEWSSSVSKRLIFSSEDVKDLATEDDKPQRLLLDGVEMELHGDIADALPAEYRRMTEVFVQHQKQKDVTLMVNDFLRQRLVWPTDLVGNLIEGCPPIKSDLFFEGERLPADATAKEMQLPSHAVLHTVTRVGVKLSNGKRQIVRLPEMATIADLQVAVSATEGTARFSLTCGGRLLDGSEKITKALTDGRSIDVERPGDTVIVSLPDRSVRFQSEQREMRFTELMRKLAEAGHIPLMCLEEMPLQCKGCGRRITKQEEDFQRVPADCCRVRSLQLMDATPPAIKDSGTQGAWRVRHKRPGGRRRRAERRVQARVESWTADTQTARRLTRGVAQQTERTQVGASTQHSPPAPRPFVVYNPHRIGGRGDFDTNLLLPDAPTAGQVRAAVAAELSASPVAVRLQRWIGRRRRDRVEVFYVLDDRGWGGFFDADGRSDVGKVDRHLKDLNDDDTFPLVPGCRQIIYIRRR